MSTLSGAVSRRTVGFGAGASVASWARRSLAWAQLQVRTWTAHIKSPQPGIVESQGRPSSASRPAHLASRPAQVSAVSLAQGFRSPFLPSSLASPVRGFAPRVWRREFHVSSAAFAVPKRKQSVSRRLKRRQDTSKLLRPLQNLVSCSNCQQQIRRHHVCLRCGWHRGVPILPRAVAHWRAHHAALLRKKEKAISEGKIWKPKARRGPEAKTTAAPAPGQVPPPTSTA